MDDRRRVVDVHRAGHRSAPDGYLWLSTTGGLARFDGVRFRTSLAGYRPLTAAGDVIADSGR